ncbi:MAG: hypothetical protein NZ805_07775 [Armatimonadetes bacterium]|nr:hypothetical protein [Armatimonadota bacterium]
MRSIGFIVAFVFIVLVGAILLKGMEPRFKAKREEELQKLCESRLGRIAMALQLYLERYDNLLPPPKIWCDALESMIPPSQRPFVFHCPKLEDKKGYGYAFNAYAWDEKHNVPKWHPEMYPQSQVVLVYETTKRERNAVGTGKDIPNPGRHNGYNLFLFADGSTIALTPEEFKEMLEEGEIRFKPLKPPITR